MVKPNFIVVGAPKAATTSLCAVLADHPDVFMFPHKGTQFFSRRYDFGWDWYLSLFKDAGAAKAIGEGSASYAAGTSESPIAKRMAEHLPEARLIYIVRHPLKRVESHFAQLIDNGMKFATLSEAIMTFPPLVEASRYWTRLNDFRRFYPDEQILVLYYEDLLEDPKAFFRTCFEFLKISQDFHPEEGSTRKNTRDSKRADRAILRMIRRNPAYVKLQWAMPRWVTERLKPMFRKKVSIKIEWTDDARKYVEEKTKSDAYRLLEFCEKPLNYWSFD